MYAALALQKAATEIIVLCLAIVPVVSFSCHELVDEVARLNKEINDIQQDHRLVLETAHTSRKGDVLEGQQRLCITGEALHAESSSFFLGCQSSCTPTVV